MTTLTSTSAGRAAAYSGSGGPLLGFGNLFRKEISEWRRGRRAAAVVLVTTLIMVLTASNAAIIAWLATVVPAEVAPDAGSVPLDPLANVAQAAASPMYVFAAIFATISLLIAERDKGTLAWTLSKPVTRTSVLAAKWASSTMLLWLLAVVIPITATSVLATILYGGVPSPTTVAALSVVLALPIPLVTAITLACGTAVRSQAAVAAIAIGAWYLVPTFAANIPGLASFLPTDIDKWGIALVLGQPVDLTTPISWAIALVAMLWIGHRRLSTMEF